VSPLTQRVLIAAPLAVAAIWAAMLGGWWWTALVLAGAVLGLHELYGMTRELRPLTPAGFAGGVGVVVATHLGGIAWALLPLAAALVLGFWLSAVGQVRQRATVQLAATLFGIVWIALGAAFLVALRDVERPPDWGRDLLLATLFGVWASDIGGYVGGRLLGRRKFAPAISPKKTVEGFVVGVLAGVVAVFFWLYDHPAGDPITPFQALEIALAIALLAPLGDLFESYLKRDLGVKDSGRLLAAHGGVLDRVDALLFAGPAAYFVVLALDRT
jgi:phosphatidate cytidylyltransferase